MTLKAQTLSIVALMAPLALAQAQTNKPAAAPAIAPTKPALTPTEQTIFDIKNPTPWLNWGGDFRWRDEYMNNTPTLGSGPNLPAAGAPLHNTDQIHEQNFFRFRARVWTSITPIENLSLNTRLSAEPREFFKPAYTSTAGNKSGLEWRYGIFDSLNIQWKKPLDLPTTVTVGRQDIFLGDGWLVADGTPWDGSFTYFFDAARVNWEIKDLHTTIDAIGVIQSARPDAWLPTLGPSTQADPRAYPLSDQDERGAIFWVANKSIPQANVDGYFIYKHDQALYDKPAMPVLGDTGDIFTFGGRVSGLLQDHWKYSAEGAYQCGWKEDRRILDDTGLATTDHRALSAMGVNSKVAYLFKDRLNNQVSFNYEFLSGDDPGTKTDEMFDVLWGRWPRWTEMAPYIFSNGAETRVGQMNNLHRIGPAWQVTPMKNLDFNLSYFALFADQDVPTRTSATAAPGSATGLFSGNNNFRGHYIQAILKYKFSQHVSGHLWSEILFPGDYYANHETMSFLRAEMLFTF